MNVIRPGYELRFKEGDIVYWCHHGGNTSYSVHWGRVDTQFHDVVCVDYLKLRECRLIDGIPIEEFENEQRFRKLPKRWTYDTRLFEVSYREDPLSEEAKNLDIRNPDDVKEAYEKGLFVKSSTIFHGTIEAEITKNGFRVIKKYPLWTHPINDVSIIPSKLYFTYEEAKKEVDENISEFHRQAALSDYDWSVEQIDKTLERWQYYNGATDTEKEKYRGWILARKDVEDIETRMYGREIQWKYWKNKKWNYIEL